MTMDDFLDSICKVFHYTCMLLMMHVTPKLYTDKCYCSNSFTAWHQAKVTLLICKLHITRGKIICIAEPYCLADCIV